MGVLANLLILLWFDRVTVFGAAVLTVPGGGPSPSVAAVSAVVDLQQRAVKSLPTCDAKARSYHVAITDIHGEFICAGSLISDSWILTDAFCWKWGMKVVLGVHPGPGRTVMIQHPPEIFKDTQGQSILMLLKLPYPTKIKSIPLPPCPPPADLENRPVALAGYRLITSNPTGETDSRESHELQCVKIKLSNCEKAKKWSFCLSGENDRVDVTPVDGGGGLVYDDRIYGVLAYEDIPLRTGRASYWGVCDYQPWINNIIT